MPGTDEGLEDRVSDLEVWGCEDEDMKGNV